MDKLGGKPADPSSWNRYAYAHDNPLKLVDANGKWSSHFTFITQPVHQASIDRTLSNLSASDRSTLKAAQVTMDKRQDVGAAYLHAMRSPGQSVEQASRASNDFVHKEISLAQELESNGMHDAAVGIVGQAMHVMQDATSPTHAGFQIWNGEGSLKNDAEGAEHVLGENFDPGKGSELDKETQKVWDWFVGTEPIPANVFEGVSADQPVIPPPPIE